MKPASWIHVALGGWLIVAPFALGYTSHTARSEDIILGLAVFSVALKEGRSIGIPSGALVLQLIFASWIFLAPFSMAYVGTWAALINDIVVSALLIITTIAMMTERTIAGPVPHA